MKDWIALPAGPFVVGLLAEEARRLAAMSARRAAANRDPLAGWSPEPDAAAIEEMLLALHPAHEVELPASALAAAPVTNAEFAEFVRAVGGPEPSGWRNPTNAAPELPVIGVSWTRAAAYAAWRGGALPSEAQWERAARGSKRRLFPWGDDYGAPGANLDEEDYLLTWAAGSRPRLATPEGCLDLVTRRWEWCADPFLPYPGGDPARFAAAHPRATPEWRARRGGEWGEVVACGAVREGMAPDVDAATAVTTFRLARPA